MIKLIKSFKYDNQYEYIKTFNTKSEQEYYFNKLSHIILDDDNYIKEHLNSFKIPFKYDYLVNEGVNYVIFNNGYKDIYAFIIEKQYVSEEVTRIIFDVDVIQTYIFDFTINKSFIERKVCSIDEITDFDEGLNIGEHIIEGEVLTLEKEYEYFAMFNGIKQQELVFENNSVKDVITLPNPTMKPSTIIDGIPYPIHFMKLQNEYDSPIIKSISIPSSGVTGGIGNGGAFDGIGKISREGFRFIKGYEGFAPRQYQDSGGYWTIAYGVTLHGEKEIYQDLVSKQPLTEQEGAQVSYRLKNENYASKIAQRCKELGITKQYQFDALVSLAYNCGIGVVLNNNSLTNAILNHINNEDIIRPIWENFYVTSNGTYLSGLAKRRVQECNMFFNKNFEIRKIPLVNTLGLNSGYVTDNNGDGWLPE